LILVMLHPENVKTYLLRAMFVPLLAQTLYNAQDGVVNNNFLLSVKVLFVTHNWEAVLLKLILLVLQNAKLAHQATNVTLLHAPKDPMENTNVLTLQRNVMMVKHVLLILAMQVQVNVLTNTIVLLLNVIRILTVQLGVLQKDLLLNVYNLFVIPLLDLVNQLLCHLVPQNAHNLLIVLLLNMVLFVIVLQELVFLTSVPSVQIVLEQTLIQLNSLIAYQVLPMA
jgi:hypothetical protein